MRFQFGSMVLCLCGKTGEVELPSTRANYCLLMRLSDVGLQKFVLTITVPQKSDFMKILFKLYYGKVDIKTIIWHPYMQ